MVKRTCDGVGIPELTTIRLGLGACSYKLNSVPSKLKMESESERVASPIALPKLSEFIMKTESDDSSYPSQTVIAGALLMERLMDRDPVQCSRCFSFSQQ